MPHSLYDLAWKSFSGLLGRHYVICFVRRTNLVNLKMRTVCFLFLLEWYCATKNPYIEHNVTFHLSSEYKQPQLGLSKVTIKKEE